MNPKLHSNVGFGFFIQSQVLEFFLFLSCVLYFKLNFSEKEDNFWNLEFIFWFF